MNATRKVELVGIKQDGKMGPGGGCFWATLRWDDGDYAYHYIHMEVTEEEAQELGKNLFRNFTLSLSLSDD